MEYEAVIGLEVHSQLLTRSKMFCECSTHYQGSEGNTLVCPVCLGAPGTLPVINRQAVAFTIMTGLALGCSVAQYSKFDRKNYPYPDLMKGFQISQYDAPLCHDGWLDISDNGAAGRVGIIRVHLEEDVAKLMHRADFSGESYSLVDVNRSGAPLMEIVSHPDMRSPEQARNYLMKLRSILQYLGVSTCNMEEGSFRCDANISVRPRGSPEMFPRVEVKNMNSFKAVYQALSHEIERQTAVVEGGRRVVQETRGWLDDKGVTVSQRTKEFAHDYRYFPEPDLPPLQISGKWVEELKALLPELPDARRRRLMSEYGLPAYDAAALTASRAMADFFEATVRAKPLDGEPLVARSKTVSNWALGELAHLLNLHRLDIGDAKVRPHHLSEILDLIEEGIVSSSMAKELLQGVYQSGRSPREMVQEMGLIQVSDATVLEQAAEQAIQANPQAVADYMKGKGPAVQYLVGQVMKLTKGRANPGLVNQALREKLEARRGH
ncbi:MAG: Asp-tRNA(Asn)/Glu-tRNA(Gln) amidotransferase subunit GatB [Chloroflexi bacterium]|nr:Asp-tRNA(Asn)/Glu-tRNA(Gln) amidotransferase subunit GatB [Chloroflexota bacterium]